MEAVLQTIRILVVILVIRNVRCQDGFSDQDLLRLQQLASNDGQVETITSYSTNIIQRDPNSQSMSSVSVQYHMSDDKQEEDYNRSDRGRTRKVYRIKNPFQRPEEGSETQQNTNTESDDSGTGASNQYASMQYSLPPEEFLQQMRAERQYYQQQQSTPAPVLSYTATPQPQYQYSTPSPLYDNNNQVSNQISQLDPKMSQLSQSYQTNSNQLQYNSPSSYGLDTSQSTPSPIPSFVSTSLPSSQYIGTPANSYVSSSSPIYLSSQSSLQEYASSPLSILQTGSPDYGNRATTTLSNNYNNNDSDKKLQIDHYDNSGNGMRYPINLQQQYDYPSSTASPSSSPYSNAVNDPWSNTGVNSVSKSLQELSLSQYNNYPYNQRSEQSADNGDTHRVGNIQSAANNLFMNVVQPDYQLLNSLKSRTRDLEQETAQSNFYSSGDYGWKLFNKKSATPQENYPVASYQSQKYQNPNTQSINSNGAAVSQMSFHIGTNKPYNYNQISKSGSENLEAQEFAKAAAKAHENLKQHQQLQLQQHQQQQQQQHQHHQQQLYNSYGTPYNSNTQNYNSQFVSSFYGNTDKNKNKLFSESSNSNNYIYGNSQQDLINSSPFYQYTNNRESNLDVKSGRHPFDHAKALKNIVPIDVSNVVSNSDVPSKTNSDLDTRYSGNSNFAKEFEQNLKQFYKPVTDSFYKDKNTIYGFNIKSKPEDILGNEGLKSASNLPYFGKEQNQEQFYGHGLYSEHKRYAEPAQTANFITQGPNQFQDNIQSSANVQQQGQQYAQSSIAPNDIASILKLNDIPYRLTQSLSADALRLNNKDYDQSSIPTPLPIRINQNVGSHQIDVSNSILNKFMLNKPNHVFNRPDIDSQNSGLLSTINGFKVANPFNVDLKLVAEMLKGKQSIDDSQLLSLRDQYSSPLPLKLDISQIQQLLLKNENSGNITPLGDGIVSLGNPYLDAYSGRYPFQGVKYSRSQEEEENIPIADASSNHPIGAVMEQDDLREASTGTELTAQEEDIPSNFGEDRPKNIFGSNLRGVRDRHRHPNSLLPGRQRKYPKSESLDEPYPLLKPPPPRSARSRGHPKLDKRRRRVKKPRVMHIIKKTEPLFEAGSEDQLEQDSEVHTLLQPPPIAEVKADVVDDVSS